MEGDLQYIEKCVASLERKPDNKGKTSVALLDLLNREMHEVLAYIDDIENLGERIKSLNTD